MICDIQTEMLTCGYSCSDHAEDIFTCGDAEKLLINNKCIIITAP